MQSFSNVYEEPNYDEPDYSLFLPRNLSYDEESVLDTYSVSSGFVRRRSVPDSSSSFATKTKIVYKILKDTMSGFRDCVTQNGESDLDEEADDYLKGKAKNNGKDLNFNSNDSDFSEEGVFVNMIDDLDVDSNGKSNDSDDCSQCDCYADSINSPVDDDEDNLGEGQEVPKGDSENQTMHKNEWFEKAKAKCVDGKFIPHISIEGRRASFDTLEFGSQKSIAELLADDEPVQYEESEFNFNKGELRKSSSLKSNKTPPGTPSRKKMVRFADAMGLDLEDVRHVINTDAPPKIPASAMSDLKTGLDEDRKSIGNRFLAPCFSQPGAMDDFLQSVLLKKVCLENAVITQMTITGFVRVANIGYHKSVRIRYSTNSWGTFHDISASYVQNSCDGPTDRFSFSIVAPDSLGVYGKLEFAISYKTKYCTYWDNNSGNNYVFECFAKTTPTENEDSWVHFV